MSDASRGPPDGEEPRPTETAPAEPAPPVAAPLTQAPRRPRSGLPAFGLALVAVVALVLLSPLWAPRLAPLLPWAGRLETLPSAALAARVAALEQRPAADRVAVEEIGAAQTALARRVDALEAGLDKLRHDEADLAQRLEGLRRGAQAAADAQQALTQLSQKVDAVVAQATANGASLSAQTDRLSQQLGQYAKTVDGLAARLDGLEHQLRSENGAGGNALPLLALAQMRAAVEEGRPFPTEYDVFASLAARDPKLAAAAAPLAEAAQDGVASRPALAARLRELGERLAATGAPAAKSKWWAQALAQLRGLVTIRRIGVAESGRANAVDAAQAALGDGDLAGAITALDGLTGADAAAAQPWLQPPRRRRHPICRRQPRPRHRRPCRRRRRRPRTGRDAHPVGARGHRRAGRGDGVFCRPPGTCRHRLARLADRHIARRADRRCGAGCVGDRRRIAAAAAGRRVAAGAAAPATRAPAAGGLQGADPRHGRGGGGRRPGGPPLRAPGRSTARRTAIDAVAVGASRPARRRRTRREKVLHRHARPPRDRVSRSARPVEPGAARRRSQHRARARRTGGGGAPAHRVGDIDLVRARGPRAALEGGAGRARCRRKGPLYRRGQGPSPSRGDFVRAVSRNERRRRAASGPGSRRPGAVAGARSRAAGRDAGAAVARRG